MSAKRRKRFLRIGRARVGMGRSFEDDLLEGAEDGDAAESG